MRYSPPTLVALAALALLLVPGAPGLELVVGDEDVHLEEIMSIGVVEANSTVTLEVMDPDAFPIYVYSMDPVEGNATFRFGIRRSRPGNYSVHASSEFGGDNASFLLTTPEFSVSAIDVEGKPRVNNTVLINGTVVNDGTSAGSVRVVIDILFNSTSDRLAVVQVFLEPGENWTFSESWMPGEKGLYLVTVSLTSVSHPEYIESDNNESIIITIVETPSTGDGEDDGGTVIIVIIVIVTIAVLGSLGALFAASRTRFQMFCLFAPLYSRIGRKDLFNNEVRGMVFGFITAHQGAHYTRIKEDLGLPNGTLAYHLKVLLRHEQIVGLRDGRLRRFYTQSSAPRGRRIRELSRTQVMILDKLERSPGSTQKDLAGMLYLTQSAISYNMGLLQRRGYIRAVGKKNIKYLLVPGPPNYRCPHCGMEYRADPTSFCPKCGERADLR